ncbi:MAG: hypothetical protein K9G59_03190 [Caulobacter sp.]|nr:hypothetical protein [Caulobacter sp.]
MRTYTVYIRDVRYSVPQLLFVNVKPDVLVADLARQKLDESEHYLAVEVLDGDTLLFRLVREGVE